MRLICSYEGIHRLRAIFDPFFDPLTFPIRAVIPFNQPDEVYLWRWVIALPHNNPSL
jgi:hypothetical protein